MQMKCTFTANSTNIVYGLLIRMSIRIFGVLSYEIQMPLEINIFRCMKRIFEMFPTQNSLGLCGTTKQQLRNGIPVC